MHSLTESQVSVTVDIVCLAGRRSNSVIAKVTTNYARFIRGAHCILGPRALHSGFVLLLKILFSHYPGSLDSSGAFDNVIFIDGTFLVTVNLIQKMKLHYNSHVVMHLLQ